MILVAEMTWTGTMHAPGNSATIQTIAAAFPEQGVRVLADASHLAELRRDPALTRLSNVDLRPIAVSPLYRGKTHIVSWRRFWRELATLRAGLRDLPAGEKCLVMLISATPTAIVAAKTLARLSGGAVRVQVGLHGNLNEITGWRPRNLLNRRFDLASAVTREKSDMLRFLVLEPAIKQALARIAPAGAVRTDVLPLPINPAEMPEQSETRLSAPIRIGFVGQATAAKGFDVFLSLAREIKAVYGARVEFHLVGRIMPGTDAGPLDVLADPPRTEHLPRSEFVAALSALHYVLLPFRSGYYDLSASGALIDAITWLKPVIASNVPLASDFFDCYGDIGFLCDGPEGLRGAVRTILDVTDDARYRRQVDALDRVREARRPRALAVTYRRIVQEGFPALLA